MQLSSAIARGVMAAILLLPMAGLDAQTESKNGTVSSAQQQSGTDANASANPTLFERAAAAADAVAPKADAGQAIGAPFQSDPSYIKAHTEYQIWVLDINRRAYEWNQASSIIIFFLVVFLVLSGVWFSWMQFRLAHHHGTAGSVAVSTVTTSQTTSGESENVETAAEKDSITEFSASPTGIKVASSAIGVVILVISMCFFYLYLEKVYPVMVNSLPSSSQASGKN